MSSNEKFKAGHREESESIKKQTCQGEEGPEDDLPAELFIPYLNSKAALKRFGLEIRKNNRK